MRTLVSGILLVCSLGMLGAAPPGAPPLPPQPKVRPAGIPAHYVMVTPCIAHMGEHWADPSKPLDGTAIYGTMNGKPVFTEIMLTPKDIAAGKSFDEMLVPLPGYKIDHVDMDFMPHGHAGMPFAHYDIHAYYVPHSVHMAFCPNATE